MRNDVQRGLITESKFILAMAERGIGIAYPFHRTHRYDYLIFINNKWRTVQVKSSRLVDRGDGRKRKHITIQLTTRSGGKKQGRYKKGDFDLLFTTFGDWAWLIPFEELGNNRMRCIIDTLRLNKYKRRI